MSTNLMAKEKELTTDTVELRISAHPQYLCVARSVIRKVAEMASLASEQVDKVTLALEEALTNAIRHSYGGPSEKPIVIKIRKIAETDDKNAALEIIIRDFGKQVDPASIKSRDLDQVKPGGLGVHIIQSLMDEMEYSCPAEGGMQLRMVKYICPDRDEARPADAEQDN